MGFHNAVYGSDDVALLSTFIFGYVGALVTLATMTLIPFGVIHFLSNLMLSLKKHGAFANDFTGIILGVIWFLAVVLFVYVYKLDKKKYSSRG
jgi:hypothetical protein